MNNEDLLNLLSKKNLRVGNKREELKEKKIDVWQDIGININTKVSENKPSVRTPHIDNPTKIYGGLLYERS